MIIKVEEWMKLVGTDKRNPVEWNNSAQKYLETVTYNSYTKEPPYRSNDRRMVMEQKEQASGAYPVMYH